MDQTTMNAFTQQAGSLFGALAETLARLDAVQRAGGLSPLAAGQLASLRTAFADLQGPATQRLSSGALREAQWTELAELITQRAMALSVAVKNTPDGAAALRAALSGRDRLEQIVALFEAQAIRAPSFILLAGGAAAAFALAWFLFRERSQMSLELAEEPAAEYLPPPPPHEPQGPRESYELDEIEDAEFEPA